MAKRRDGKDNEEDKQKTTSSSPSSCMQNVQYRGETSWRQNVKGAKCSDT